MAYENHAVKIGDAYFICRNSRMSVHAPTQGIVDKWKRHFNRGKPGRWEEADLKTDVPFVSMASGGVADSAVEHLRRGKFAEMVSDARELPYSFRLENTGIPDKVWSHG